MQEIENNDNSACLVDVTIVDHPVHVEAKVTKRDIQQKLIGTFSNLV